MRYGGDNADMIRDGINAPIVYMVCTCMYDVRMCYAGKHVYGEVRVGKRAPGKGWTSRPHCAHDAHTLRICMCNARMCYAR